MDEDTREQIVEMLTRVGMMAEDLSVVALGRATKSAGELYKTVRETRRRSHEISELITHAGILIEGK